MNAKTLLLLGCLCSSTCVLANENEIAVRLYGGQLNLEGPAVTGPGDDVEGEDVDGYGIQIEYRRELPQNFFGKAQLDWAAWDDNFQLYHLTAGVGKPFTLHAGESFSLGTYLLLTAEFVSAQGLEEYEGNPDFGGLGTGEDGNDFGVGLETGLTLATPNGWGGDLYAKYYNFGEGDGPAFGLRVEKALNELWTLQGSWDGTWVEHAGYNIDLAHQKFTLGVARRF